MCDCIKKLYEEIKKEKDVKYSKISLSTIVDYNSKNPINKTGQQLRIIYRHKRKDGIETEKTENTFITHNFCPFCGKKYPTK